MCTNEFNGFGHFARLVDCSDMFCHRVQQNPVQENNEIYKFFAMQSVVGIEHLIDDLRANTTEKRLHLIQEPKASSTCK